MPKAEGKKAAACSGNYQDNITMPISCEYDYDAAANDETDELAADLDPDADAASGMQSAIERVDITQSCIELIKLKYILISFGRSLRLYAQVLNIVRHGLVKFNSRKWKRAGFLMNPAPPYANSRREKPMGINPSNASYIISFLS
jgi:hypothetical protein